MRQTLKLLGFNPLRWSSSGETRLAARSPPALAGFNPLRWSSSGETRPCYNSRLIQKFQSTPLVFQRRNGCPSRQTRPETVSIHSAGLPAEKRDGDRGATASADVSIHSAGLPAEKRADAGVGRGTGLVSIHSAGLPAEKQSRAGKSSRLNRVSIHSAGLPAEKRACSGNAASATAFQSTPLVFQRRNSHRGWRWYFRPLFQSTPLVFQRRN